MHSIKKKILFILRRREDYSEVLHSSHLGLSTGLFNSATFMNDMLNKRGIESELVVVIDNNNIDREVNKHKPTHVIIEALWVVPSKFEILSKLHPNVKWIIRLHSEIPFLAGEGMAFDWIGNYFKNPNVLLAANAPRMLEEAKTYLSIKFDENSIKDRIIYLPNFYPTNYKTKKNLSIGNRLHIGCFGAIRPLKNQMLQSLAALDFATSIRKPLTFHINGDRIEMKGSPVLNNLRSLFTNLSSKGHILEEHTWTPREEFLDLCSQMDIGMQVSFSETFNIVGADFISQGVPIVVSSEIPWASDNFTARPTESKEIVKALKSTYLFPKRNVTEHQRNLKQYSENSSDIWVNYFKGRHTGFSGLIEDVIDEVERIL